MKNLYFSFIISLCFLNSFGQQSKIDSLITEISKSKNEHIKIKSLVHLVDLFDDSVHPNDLKYIDELMRLSKKNEDFKSLITGLKAYSTIFAYKREFDKSINYILKAIKVSDSINDKTNLLNTIIQAGYIYIDAKKPKKALEILKKGERIIIKNPEILGKCKLFVSLGYYFSIVENEEKLAENYIKALRCLDSQKEDNYIDKMGCFRGLCWSYITRKEYEKSKKYALLGLKKAEKANLDLYKAFFHRILGRIYSDTNQLDEAVKYYLLVKEYFKTSIYKSGESDAVMNLSFIYWKKKNYLKSLEFADESIVIGKSINDSILINSGNISKAMALTSLKKFNQAEKILNEVASDTINHRNWPSYLREDLLINLVEVNENKGNYKKALFSNKMLLKLKDSLNDINFSSKVTEIETKYHVEQKNNKILSQSLTLEKENSKKQLYKFVSSIVGIIALFLILLLYKRKKQFELEQYKYHQEVIKVKTLKQSLKDIKEHKNKVHKENETKFHNELKKKYSLTKVTLDYWISQAEGISEKEMAKRESRSKGAVESRRKRLYEKIKEVEGIDYSIWLSKEESTRIYRENWQLFSF